MYKGVNICRSYIDRLPGPTSWNVRPTNTIDNTSSLRESVIAHLQIPSGVFVGLCSRRVAGVQASDDLNNIP